MSEQGRTLRRLATFVTYESARDPLERRHRACRKLLQPFRSFGIDGNVGAEIVVLPPGHPYLGLPLQFATALEERLLSLVAADELEQLRKDRETESRSPAAGAPPSRSLQWWD